MSNSNSIVDLYTRIPDYSEVKHLGNSDFINTVERLKEEFRKCRAILNEDSDEVDYICSTTSKILNISQNQNHQKKSALKTTTNSSRNVNIVSPKGNNNLFYLPATNNINNSSLNKTATSSSYLSISSCALHKNPNDFNLTGGSGGGGNLRPSDRVGSGYSCIFREGGGDSRPNYEESAYADDFELCSSEASTPESVLSRWSSSPEINSTIRDKEYCPPTNVEKRLLIRRSQNNSAPSIPDIEPKSPRFKAHPVPAHVHKPLFDYIMLKNKKRSDRVREQSKQKLLAQVKPFSFSNDTRIPKCVVNHGVQIYERGDEFMLNNSRPVKARRHHHPGQSGIKTNNNKFSLSHHQFKASPAPPRTKALLAAIKLREQQEYRALKKRLRAEAMMKTASLPPSMAARDRRTKANLTRLDNLLSQFQASDKDKDNKRHFRESSTDTFTDEDRLTEEGELYNTGDRRGTSSARQRIRGRGTGQNLTSMMRPLTSRPMTTSMMMNTGRVRHKSGNFTPYNEPKITGVGGLFEATSNDNHASKLRIQVAKAKELGNIQKEEEELLRAMKTDRKRQKLRDAHFQAWRRAGSYSSAQDIAMRRQLRQAAAILDRESYRKEMSNMLTRVRSAPLLLEGLRERKSEPCKKHRDELSTSTTNKTLNKLSSPRYTGQRHYFNSKTNWGLSRDPAEPEKSETAALAEGSLTNSDNESVKNLPFDEDAEKGTRGKRPKNPDLEFDHFDKEFQALEQQQVKEFNKHENSHQSLNGNGEHSSNNNNGQEYHLNGKQNNHLKVNGQNVKSPPLITIDTYSEEEEGDADEEEEEEEPDDEQDHQDVNDQNYQDETDRFEEDLNEEDIFANF